MKECFSGLVFSNDCCHCLLSQEKPILMTSTQEAQSTQRRSVQECLRFGPGGSKQREVEKTNERKETGHGKRERKRERERDRVRMNWWVREKRKERKNRTMLSLVKCANLFLSFSFKIYFNNFHIMLREELTSIQPIMATFSSKKIVSLVNLVTVNSFHKRHAPWVPTNDINVVELAGKIHIWRQVSSNLARTQFAPRTH